MFYFVMMVIIVFKSFPKWRLICEWTNAAGVLVSRAVRPPESKRLRCKQSTVLFVSHTQLCSSSGVKADTSQQVPGKAFLCRVYMLAASVSLWVKWTLGVKCGCDCLLIIVGFVTDWQLIQGVSCLLPNAFWDTIQSVVQDLVMSNCSWIQHTYT